MSKSKLFTYNGVKLQVTRCKRPKFSSHRGRTWDTGKFFINDRETTLHLDTTWGEYVYFQYGKYGWFKFKMYRYNPTNPHMDYNIDPFEGVMIREEEERVELLHWYMKGFNDELNSVTSVLTKNHIHTRAYHLGSTHAVIGDEVSSIDELSEDEIIKMITNARI